MKYRNLGRSGVRVSEVGLGSWLTFGGTVDRKATRACVDKAFELGVNFVDTADVYALGEAERVLGQILVEIPRKDFVLASKVFFPTGEGPNDRGLSRKHIYESVHASLRRLRTDYLDLYQCHRFDEEAPLEETVRAMDDLVRHGKILYWGVSSWSAEQIHAAAELTKSAGYYPVTSNQPLYNLLERGIEEDVLPTCHRHGMGAVVYSPLAQGVLSGKYQGGQKPRGSRAAHPSASQFMQRYLREDRLRAVEELQGLASELGCSSSQLALAWCLRREEVASVIVGATSQHQIVENVGAVGVELSADVIDRLDALFPPGHD